MGSYNLLGSSGMERFLIPLSAIFVSSSILYIIIVLCYAVLFSKDMKKLKNLGMIYYIKTICCVLILTTTPMGEV